MTNNRLLDRWEKEYIELTIICDKQFEEIFSTSKREDSWSDDLFREYQTTKIRLDLILELLNDEK